MTGSLIKIRKVFFMAVEGESEQSFVKWLKHHSDQMGLLNHFDCVPLGGGGYPTMLKKAVSLYKRRGRAQASSSILIVDADRAMDCHDGWSLDQLRQEALSQKFELCLQCPNLEGIFLRMLSEKDLPELKSTDACKKLLKVWPSYRKPADALTLNSKLRLNSLFRVARTDPELKKLLRIIGLYPEH